MSQIFRPFENHAGDSEPMDVAFWIEPTMLAGEAAFVRHVVMGLKSEGQRVTFIAHLQPSRQDVPEYAEYLERIEALVAVVNHRHGTTDWMPIDLRIYENFPEAVARYKHFDLLIVNSLFDGMNLVAKEAPAVNTRDGVVMLSENTGAHEALGDCTLTVNPFDIQEQADAIYRALTMDPEERRLRADRLRVIVDRRDPGDWVDEQLADIRAKAAGRERVGG